MSRLAPLNLDEQPQEVREEYDHLARGRKPRPDGTFGGPFDTWLRSPEMSRALRRFGGLVWERTSLDRGIVELAICVAGRHWSANVEWRAHEPRAVEHGIPQSVMDDVLAGRAPSTDREDIASLRAPVGTLAGASALLVWPLGDSFLAPSLRLSRESGEATAGASTSSRSAWSLGSSLALDLPLGPRMTATPEVGYVHGSLRSEFSIPGAPDNAPFTLSSGLSGWWAAADFSVVF